MLHATIYLLMELELEFGGFWNLSMVNLGVSESEGYVRGIFWYTLEYLVMIWLVLRLVFGKMGNKLNN